MNTTNTTTELVTSSRTDALLCDLEKLGCELADVDFFYGTKAMTPTKEHYESLVRELRDPIYRGLGRKAAKRAFEAGFTAWASELNG